MELRLIFISQTTPSTELNYLTTCGWPDSAQIKNLVGQNKTISRNKVANTTSSKFWDSLASVSAMSVLRTRCRTSLAFIPFVVQTVSCTFTVGFTPKLTYCGFSSRRPTAAFALLDVYPRSTCVCVCGVSSVEMTSVGTEGRVQCHAGPGHGDQWPLYK